MSQQNSIKRYSEAFKLSILRQVSEGRKTIAECARLYGCSAGVIYKWINKYDRLDLYHTVIRIEMPDEKQKIKELQARIAALEKALADTHLECLKAQAERDVALNELGKPGKDFLKKGDSKS